MDLGNVRIVLVNTSHAGNIGATARAMKNMHLSRLFLVSPENFPSPEATARASGADDVLAEATICDSLDDALVDCVWVVGATARARRIGWPTFTPRTVAADVIERAVAGPVAIVFGRERMGLTNEEVDKCQALVSIPSNADYCSLNVASAVQILAYETHLAALDVAGDTVRPLPTSSDARNIPSSADDMERYYEHLEKVLVGIDFLDPDNPRKLMRRLRRMYSRTAPDNIELNILRGILTAIQETQHWHG